LRFGVPLDISQELGEPIVPVCGRLFFAEPALMLVPEAAVNEDRFSESWEYQIGCARKSGSMEPVTISHPVRELPYRELRSRILLPDAPHVIAEFHVIAWASL
jgi:hypothetical protein